MRTTTHYSRTEDYAYDLPADLIAQQPLECRSHARLMVVHRRTETIEHLRIDDLPRLLREGDEVVLNDTRVVPARLVGYRERTRGRWEGLFLREEADGSWLILGKTRGRVHEGEVIVLVDRSARDESKFCLVHSLGEGQWRVRRESSLATIEHLEKVGRVPLPHYIRDGVMMAEDIERYQTVYGDRPGSVAAPTAGLHFTDDLLTQLRERGVGNIRITLHVGLGTFRPISAETLDEHRMHAEWGSISLESAAKLRQCRESGGRVVAVGTTSCRLLETAGRDGEVTSWTGETDLFIRPPFEFHATDALLTNFHLPRSSLLVLVRTFGGDALIRHAYDVAIRQQYRFYSYGDAMLIL